MTKKKQQPPVHAIEYRLLITHKYNEQLKKTTILVALRTREEFSNFTYEIVVNDTVQDGVLSLDLHGLRTPKHTIPSSGPAVFKKEFDHLNGVRKITVSKLGKELNVFTVKILKDKVAVESTPEKPFVDMVTSEEEWQN
jgi:hypothetical protein